MNASVYLGIRSTGLPGCSHRVRSQTQAHKQHIYQRSNPVSKSFKKQKPSHNVRKGCSVYAAADYYEILGVPRDADLKHIKQAFKKKALKLHPDVNKAPDAKERFMECKVAYQALSDSAERARYDRSKGMGGSEAGFSWEDVVSSGARSRKAAEEAFYGLGDFFKDLDRDRTERRRSRGRAEQPMSLWEELSDIGEEFVEFLEKEIGLSAPREETYSSARTYETEGSAEQARRQVREAEERARRAAATAEEGARKVNDDIEEMLQKMKRDLGVK